VVKDIYQSICKSPFVGWVLDASIIDLLSQYVKKPEQCEEIK